MSNIATPVAGQTGLAASAGALPRQQSLLFPSIFEKLPKGDRFSVLDIGPATPETLRFFSPWRCHLHFASMFSEDLVRQGIGEMDHDQAVAAYTEALAIREGTRFDLCMFWDFPNYLDDAALKAFAEALTPFLHAKTVGHGFAVRASGTRLGNRWYGIDQPHLFTVRPARDPQPNMYPHAQAILINLLTCFGIDRGMLLPDGRLEVAMSATIL